jgi:Tol biopolymer transport system component
LRHPIAAVLLLLLGACADEAGEGAGDNQPPVLTVLAAETDEDLPVILDLLATASDPDGDEMFLRTARAKDHTVVVNAEGKVSLTPAPNFHGVIELIYEISDRNVTSTGKAMITVRPVNDAPEAKALSIDLLEDQQGVAVALEGSDVEGDALSFELVTPPAHGTLAGTPPALTYTPAANFFGQDTLVYRASDGAAASAATTVRLAVASVNDPPVLSMALEVDEDVAETFTFAGTDPDGDPLSYTVVMFPSHGALSGTGATRTYQPSANYHGPDELRVTIGDGKTLVQNLVVPIVVSPVDDAPTAFSISASTSEDTQVSVTLRGADRDGDALSYQITTSPQHGTLSGTPPMLTYVPALNYNGADSFAYTVTAGTATSAPATGSIAISAVNDAPVPVEATVTTAEDASVAIRLQGTDVDSSSLTYNVFTQPSDGFLSGSGANRTYSPALNASGTRTFMFSVSDGVRTSYGTMTIVITPMNDPPIARVDFVSTLVDEPLEISVLSNDSDVDGDVLSIDSVTAPAHGEVEIVANQLVYTPEDGYSGSDQLSYTLVDAAGVTATSSVTVGVGEYPAAAPRETIAVAGAAAFLDVPRMPSISGDGRYVAFVSALRLVPQDTDDRQDVYVYDRGKRKLRRASEQAGGTSTNGSSVRPNLSADGRYVVFESSATNLAPGDLPGFHDVFRKDLVSGAVVLVSVSSAGVAGNGDSTQARISDDGNLVVFTSRAFNLAASDVNGATDVFLRDLAAGTTQRLSISVVGGDADLASSSPAISGDGTHVAFQSLASNLVAGDQNDEGDVFVRELATGTTTRVSVSTNGIEGNASSSAPSLARGGRFVSFVSQATNLVPGNQSSSVFVRDRTSLITTRPQTSVYGWPQLSGDGRHLCARDNQATFLYDRFAAAYTPFTPPFNVYWDWPAISSNGRYVVFVESTTGAIIVAPNPR